MYNIKYTESKMVKDTTKLVAYINWLNAKGQAMMEDDPHLWVGMLTTDLDHWASYGITTPDQLGEYLDAQSGDF
jgi:hypothetical protein